jgi:hypothetical protein
MPLLQSMLAWQVVGSPPGSVGQQICPVAPHATQVPVLWSQTVPDWQKGPQHGPPRLPQG